MKTKLLNSSISLPRLFLFNICAFVAACFAASVAIAGENSYNIIEVAKADVEAQGCSYLGEVWGVSGGKLSKWNRFSANSSKHKAEDKALKMAAELDATHLVWSELTGESDGHHHVYADAYRCGSGAKSSDIAKKNSEIGNQIN